MATLPPDPTNATLKKVYPWKSYDATVAMQWLYAQAQRSGFKGTYEEFKEHYGQYMQPDQKYRFYRGSYTITPQNEEQVINTTDKVMQNDIVIEPIPEELLQSYPSYTGQYEVIPMADVDQILRTKETVLKNSITVEKIPVHVVDNDAGGRTVTIG